MAGVSRAGITWLSRALNQHPDIAVFGQSRFWGKHYIEPDQNGLYLPEHRARIVDKIRAFEWDATVGDGPGCFPGVSLDEFRRLLASSVEACDSPSTPRHLYRAMATAVASLSGARIVIEKTPHHVLHAERIRRQFRDAKFILLWCAPQVHMAVLKGQADLRHHPLAAALAWRRYDAAITDQADRHDARTAVVDTAHLARQAHTPLDRLVRFLDAEPCAWPVSIPPFDFGIEDGELPPLDAADEHWLEKVNGVAQTRSKDRAGRRLAVLRSMLSLPAYVLHNLRVSRREVEGPLPAYYRRWLSGDAP